MIFYLMRRNLPEPLALIVCAFVTFTIFGAPQIGLVVGAPFLFIMWTAVAHRASAFEVTMPIRGRDIVAARVLWQLAILAPPIIACLYASLIGNREALHADRVLDASLVTGLAILLPYAIRPEEVAEPPFLVTAAAWLALAATSAGILYFLPHDLALEILLVATVVAGRVIWMRIPTALELAPRMAAIAEPSKLVLHTGESTREWIPRAWRPLVHAFVEPGTKAPILLLFYVLALAYGAMGPGRSQPFMVIYFASPIAILRKNNAWLSAFPISKRARLWILLVPTLVVGLGLFALGRAVHPFFPREDPMLVRAPELSSEGSGGRVPLEFWQEGSAGIAPVVTAPWGESTRADTISIVGSSFFNPYSTGATNSARFAEWQLERATLAVFGHAIDREQYKQLKAANTYPGTVLESARMRVLIAAAILAGALLAVFLNEISYSHRKAIRSRGIIVIQYVASVLIVGPVFFGIFYLGRGMSDVLAPLLLRLFLRLSASLPANIVAFTIIAALPVFISYALVERQFGRSDFGARTPSSAPKWARALQRPIW